MLQSPGQALPVWTQDFRDESGRVLISAAEVDRRVRVSARCSFAGRTWSVEQLKRRDQDQSADGFVSLTAEGYTVTLNYRGENEERVALLPGSWVGEPRDGFPGVWNVADLRDIADYRESTGELPPR